MQGEGDGGGGGGRGTGEGGGWSRNIPYLALTQTLHTHLCRGSLSLGSSGYSQSFFPATSSLCFFLRVVQMVIKKRQMLDSPKKLQRLLAKLFTGILNYFLFFVKTT